MAEPAPAEETPAQSGFRAYCRQWLAANHPGRPPVPIPQGAEQLTDPAAMAWLRQWQKAAYEAGLVGCDYPVAVGGGGRENCQAIANQEMQRAKTPYLANIVALACEIAGAASTLAASDPNAPAGGQWPLAYMNSFGGTIAAGTSEVQRNILGERVLGLPRSR